MDAETRRTNDTPLLEALEPRLLLSGSVVVSEFMASNDTTILDGDGGDSDWIELHNPTSSPVNLEGWFLTDKADNLDKWEIPDITLAANGDASGNDYLVVFASGADNSAYPYWDGQYYHTNFTLSKEGESVLLVHEDGITVEHGYEYYPEQVTDISYGIGSDTPIYDELVSGGALVSYLVPTAGDANLMPDTAPGGDPGWTGLTFDDSGWSDTTVLDPAGMVITEIDSDAPNFVEIQNVSASAINTTGWAVLVNDASGGINGVDVLDWSLPASVAPGEVLYRSDDAGDTGNYWGGDIDWSLGGDGWAMIIDQNGDVVDFAAWGYLADDITDPLEFGFSYEIDPGVFVDIDAAGQWGGNGAVVGDGTDVEPGEVEEFISFGDSWSYLHPQDAVDPAIADTDFNTTWTQPVGYDGPAFGAPSPGMLGYGEIALLDDLLGDDQAFGTLMDTPPGGSRHAAYFRREFTLSEGISDAEIDVFCDDGAIIYIDGVEVTRANITAADTFTARATNAANESAIYTLPIADIAAGTHWIAVSIHQNQAGSSDLGFDMSLSGRGTAPVGSALQRSGNVDNDIASDFRSTTSATTNKGTENTELDVPFGTVSPATTGVGFSSASDEFDSLIQTDVGSVMQTHNASLWTRIEFSVGSTGAYDSLTLRMKYNDGFAAYLNGSLVAWRNAPGTLAWDSSADGTRSDAESVVFEDIDITAHLFGAIETGVNVLAIHALNSDVNDANLLIVPELIATGELDVQYMTSPTPGAVNSPGAMGLVDDTEFSIDRGFYETPQTLEITTDTIGASIRYTLDGTKPTETHGTLYTDPISITTTTMLRAIAYLPGFVSSNVDTQTYIFPHDVVEQTGDGFPDDWGRNEVVASGYSDYEIDPEVVGTNAAPNSEYYDDFIEGLTAIPTLSLVLPINEMFANGGLYDNPGSTSMEKETSAELIYADGTKGFQIDAGLKMQGGASRNPDASPKHSMSLRFRQQYGPGRLDFPLFEGSPVDSFNSLQLRAMYNNAWTHRDSGQRNRASLIRDQWARDALLAMGNEDAGQGAYVHLYIDGLYWGIHILQERQESSHYEAYNGGDEDTLDALNSGVANDGNTASWLAMHTFVTNAAVDGIDLTEFQAIQQKLDIESFIDYMIVNQYGSNADWDGHNWRAAGGGPDNMPWKIYSWDAERILETNALSANRIGTNNANKPSGLFTNLRQSPEFNLMFADRVHQHFFNDGALTADEAAKLWMERADQLDQAIVAESARWGDYRRDVHTSGTLALYTRNDHWIPEQQTLMNSYFNHSTKNRSEYVLEDYEGSGLYPSLDAPIFNINGSYQHGGTVASGDGLTMNNPSGQGTIYYTLDGTDPRLSGGAVNTASAVAYSGTVPLDVSAYVLARVLNGGVWSALNQTAYDVSPAPTVAITEINYNPHDPTAAEDSAGYEDAEAFEFVELRNIGSQTVDLRTVHFSDGIEFDFTRSNVTSLASGAYAVVVRNTQAFQTRYPNVDVNIIAGEFAGGLNSGGEGLELAHGADRVFGDFGFNDSNAWPGRADGKGASLEIIDPSGDSTDPQNWQSSVRYGGTPGAGPELPGGVIINEVLTHTDLPDVDSIELHNTTDKIIDIGGWFISDTWGSVLNPSNGDYKKFTIPAKTKIPAGGFIVFDEDDFNVSGGVNNLDFALSGAHGDDVWLMVADGSGDITHFADHVSFGATENGVSLGRWPDNTGALYPMLATTLGEDNATDGNVPRVGSVIISEVMYNPPFAVGDSVFQADFDSGLDGFVYADDAFNGTSNPAYAAGGYVPAGGQDASGGLNVHLGPGDTTNPTSGAWSRSLTLSAGQSLDVSFRYRLTTSDGFEFNEYTDLILEIDGVRYGSDSDGSVLRLIGPGEDTGWDTARFSTGLLTAGAHTISIGAYSNRASGSDEVVDLFIDNVKIYADTGAPATRDLEFIELYNPTGSDVQLAAWADHPHESGQYFADWRLRGGVDMEFDPGTSIASGGMLVVLSFDPNKPENAARVAAFRAYYGIDASVQLAGGYSGQLDGGGERVTLQRPDSPPAEEPDYVPHLLEDQVIYDDAAPWATSPDGLGDSLQRTPVTGWGDDAASWIAGTPDPGAYAAINDAPVVDNPIDDVVADEDDTPSVIDLSATFSDPDLTPGGLTLSVVGNTPAGMVTPTLDGAQLTLTFLPDQNGVVNITVRATDASAAWVEDTFTVTINPTLDPPVVANPVGSVAVDEDDPATEIDLMDVFYDPDLPGDELTFQVTVDPDDGLVTADVLDGVLMLSYAADQYGSADVTVRATDSNGDWIEDAFTVTVAPAADDPTVVNPIADVTADEDDAPDVVDISNVFTDADFPSDTLVFSVTGNSPAGLVTTDLDGDQLTLSYLPDQHGVADITIRATDLAGGFVEDTFTVTVNPANDAPTVVAPISDVSVNENGPDTVLNLNTVFGDIDPGDILMLAIGDNDNPGLVTAELVGSELTLSYAPSQYGQAEITIVATDISGAQVEDVFTVAVNHLAGYLGAQINLDTGALLLVNLDPASGQPINYVGLNINSPSGKLDPIFNSSAGTGWKSVANYRVDGDTVLVLELLGIPALNMFELARSSAELTEVLVDAYAELGPGEVWGVGNPIIPGSSITPVLNDGDVGDLDIRYGLWQDSTPYRVTDYEFVSNFAPSNRRALLDVNVLEDAAPTDVALVNVAVDFDHGDSLSYTISGNTDSAMVLTDIVGDQLTLSYGANQNGVAEITVRATDLAGDWVEDTFIVTVEPVVDVVGRHVFYNNSAQAASGDDDAIDASRQMMLPGQIPGPANYTNYIRGINGIMVDVSDLDVGYTPAASDFGVRVYDADASAWSVGPTPSVTIRRGDGADGSDRVTLVWDDGDIVNEWVEVTVKSDANGGQLGLVADDVFYLGNSVGDSDGDGDVDEGDFGTLLGEFGQSEDLMADFNADGRVDLNDFVTLRSNFDNTLATPTFPAPPAAPAPAAAPMAVVESAPAEPVAALEGEHVSDQGEDSPASPLAAAPVVDMLVESPLAGEYVSEAPATLESGTQLAATSEYDLQPLSDDGLSEGEGDLLTDILAESALALPL